MPDQAKPTNSGSSCSIPEESAQYLPKSTHRRQSTRRQSLRKPPPKSRSASIGCTTGATTSALRYSRSLSDASQRHGSLDSTRRPSLANINSHLASLLSLSSQVTRRVKQRNVIFHLCCWPPSPLKWKRIYTPMNQFCILLVFKHYLPLAPDVLQSQTCKQEYGSAVWLRVP